MFTAILDVYSRYAARIWEAFSVPNLILYVSMQSRHEFLVDRSADGIDAADALRPLQKLKKLTK